MSNSEGRPIGGWGGRVFIHEGRPWLYFNGERPTDRVFWSVPDNTPDTLSRLDVRDMAELAWGSVLDTVREGDVYTVVVKGRDHAS
jgi:hypothetical protein